MIELKQPRKVRDVDAARKSLVKAIVGVVTAIGTADVVSMGELIAGASPDLMEAALSLVSRKEDTLGGSAWILLRAAYAYALTEFFASADLDRNPRGKELEILIEKLLIRADLLTEDAPQVINADHLINPLKVIVLRDFSRALPDELRPFGPRSTPDEYRRAFERAVFSGMESARNRRPDEFLRIEASLSGVFAKSLEFLSAKGRHEQFLISSFGLRSIFGQEVTGITLSDLYVRQRCMTKYPKSHEHRASDVSGDLGVVRARAGYVPGTPGRPPEYVTALGDLHGTVRAWLERVDDQDHVRVVAGGPGSGKSTFAKALSIEVIDAGKYDVLFVPLQELDTTGQFETRLAGLFRSRSELGFDRVESPLNWMGQSQIDGGRPEKPLLLVCDGLDELAPPDSKEAVNVTADFIQTLNNWMSQRNSGGPHVKALILGRTIAAEEAFRKLNIDSHALLRIVGFLPVADDENWKSRQREGLAFDPQELASIDQRAAYWDNWCVANRMGRLELPVALQTDEPAAEALLELTTEPLLLYLLLWTGFVGDRWKEAAENRNVVYFEMFKRIYARDWGADRKRSAHPNREGGGHVALAEVSEAEFFALQEVLGLASWASGGRTVSSSAFARIREEYLTEEHRDELSALQHWSLKSVALQSYTRSSEDGDEGYEFVHKTLGEYLISRALIDVVHRGAETVKQRTTETRCKQAMTLVTRIACIGPLTDEIGRFLKDEISLRYSKRDHAKAYLERGLVPLVNWTLRNGAPAHESVEDIRKAPFHSLTRAATRATDVMWSISQLVADQAFALGEAGAGVGDRNVGALQIDWPHVTTFSSLFSSLSDRTHVAETKRLSSFNYLPLGRQAVTEQDFGSVLYSTTDDHVNPLTWLSASLMGCDLRQAQFFMAHLRDSNLSFSDLTEAELSNATLARANLASAILDDADLSFSDLTSTFLVGAKLPGATFYKAILNGADLTRAFLPRAKCRPKHAGARRSEDPKVARTVISMCSFRDADLREVDFGHAVIDRCDFTGADLSGAIVGGARFVGENKFFGARMDGIIITKGQEVVLGMGGGDLVIFEYMSDEDRGELELEKEIDEA